MAERDFRRAMADAHSRLEQVRMPAMVANRVRQNIGRVHGYRRMGLTLLGLAVAGAVSFAMFRTQFHSDKVARLPDGFETVSGSSDLQLGVRGEAGTIDIRRGACTLRVRGWGSVTLRAGSSLRRLEGGLELWSGEADFQVDKRAPGTGSTFVRGPQGSIEITGTRFSVIQRRDSGSVHLDEGGIRFHALLDGRTVALVPGDSLSWPLPAPTPAAVGAVSPRASVTVARSEASTKQETPYPAAKAIDTMIDRIAFLRAKGQYRELADELRIAMLRERHPLTRERLSFELGSVLSYHLKEGAQACAHWVAHRRAFPASHYSEEISDAVKTLNCKEERGSK